MKLRPLIIIVVEELRLKEQGQHFIIQQNEITFTSLFYYNYSSSK